MQYEIKEYDEFQELIMNGFRFFGTYDEMLFYYATYTAGLSCQFKIDFVIIKIDRKTMYWQADHLWQMLRRYNVPNEVLNQIEGIANHIIDGVAAVKPNET